MFLSVSMSNVEKRKKRAGSKIRERKKRDLGVFVRHLKIASRVKIVYPGLT